ncbi:LysE family translocator [Acidimicrobiaceae bacterium AH-315-P05]|nr:LysE family translocator [Acidimicrobiaceae bacterium AH-315-P05]
MDVAALVTLAFVASITPGPNNLMLLASGMNHGTRKTLPHLAGVSLGFALLIFVIAVGLGTVFERYDAVELALRLLGGAYLAYLAWKIFKTNAVATTKSEAAPMTFVQAALFQWVNPKAWVMATTASSTLLASTGSAVTGAATLTGGFWAVNLPCISTWMFSGVFASRWVHNTRRLRFINRTLGVLLAGTVILLLA